MGRVLNGKSAEALRNPQLDGNIVGWCDASAEVPMRRPGTKRAAADRIPLPAGIGVKLAPGAYRLLLPTLNRSLKLGDRVALKLIVEAPDGSRQAIPVNAEVRRRSAYDDHLHPHSHPH
jgi:hypothetical protein